MKQSVHTKLLRFIGNSISRTEVDYPSDTRWVRSQQESDERVAVDYWTCVPRDTFRDEDWKGCVVDHVCSLMVRISIPNVIEHDDLESRLIDGPELMRQFDLNNRVLARISEHNDKLTLSGVSRISLIDAPDKCLMTNIILSAYISLKPMFETSLGWNDLGRLAAFGKSCHWFVLPKVKGAEVWAKLRKYMNALYDGKPADPPYELEHDQPKIEKFDINAIKSFVDTYVDFVAQFGIDLDKAITFD